MKEKPALSLITESNPPRVSAAECDRRRLRGMATGSAVLFLAAILFGSGQPSHADFASNDYYAPSASSASSFAEYRPAATAAAPAVTETTESQAVAQKRSTEISSKLSPAEAHAAHDIYCDLYAKALIGNVTPEQAASRQRANGAIVGTIGGAFLGAVFGGSGRHSSHSTLLGASTGLLAGAAIGSSNAQAAADDIRRRYTEAYATCMKREDAGGAAQSGS